MKGCDFGTVETPLTLIFEGSALGKLFKLLSHIHHCVYMRIRPKSSALAGGKYSGLLHED